MDEDLWSQWFIVHVGTVLSHWQHGKWSEQTAVRKAYYPLLYFVLALICTCNSVPFVWVISTLKCTNWNKTELSRLTMVVTQVQNINITKRLVLIVRASSCFGSFWFIYLLSTGMNYPTAIRTVLLKKWRKHSFKTFLCLSLFSTFTDRPSKRSGRNWYGSPKGRIWLNEQTARHTWQVTLCGFKTCFMHVLLDQNTITPAWYSAKHDIHNFTTRCQTSSSGCSQWMPKWSSCCITC